MFSQQLLLQHLHSGAQGLTFPSLLALLWQQWLHLDVTEKLHVSSVVQYHGSSLSRVTHAPREPAGGLPHFWQVVQNMHVPLLGSSQKTHGYFFAHSFL